MTNDISKMESYQQSLIRRLWEAQTENLPDDAKRTMAEAAQALEGRQSETKAQSEFVSIGWQYKFPSLWGGHVWLDSPNTYNGSDYSESREIFAKSSQSKTSCSGSEDAS